MWIKRIQRSIEKNRNEVLGLLFRKYPRFVLSDQTNESIGIPAFVFHDVVAESLVPLLQYLADNRYTTLTADEYIERRLHGDRGQEREVLLTFDDGLKSLYSSVFPALKRFDLKAVAYIVPGMTPEDDGASGTGVWASSLCTWKEIQAMHQSGTLDIQCHSMYHHSIPISSRVVDFIRPRMHLSFLTSDLAPLMLRAGGIQRSDQLAYGTPIHTWGPRFGRAPAFQEDPSVALACIEHVERHGGASYFNTPKWRARLMAVIAIRRKQPTATFEIEAEQRLAILKDLVDSKREIERRLPGKTVRHFCFPWFRGSQRAVQLSAEAGYISNAWGSLLPGFIHPEESPFPVARLSSSYLWRLPGKGRKSIGAVLQQRFSQRGRKGYGHG
jgi:hypothetical protein